MIDLDELSGVLFNSIGMAYCDEPDDRVRLRDVGWSWNYSKIDGRLD